MTITIHMIWFLAVLLIMGFVAYILGHWAGRDERRERMQVLKTVQMLADKNLLRLKEDGSMAVDVEDIAKLMAVMKEEKARDDG